MKKRKKQEQVKHGRGRRQPSKGRRFTPQQQAEALRLIASRLKHKEVARVVGTTVESLRRWHQTNKVTASLSAQARATSSVEPASLAAPVGPASRVGLAPVEVEAILALKKEHPSMGPAQIRAQLKRFRGWRLSVKAIGRVLVRNGYKLVRKEARPEGDEQPRPFEAPRRNALWQMDFVDLRVRGGARVPARCGRRLQPLRRRAHAGRRAQLRGGRRDAQARDRQPRQIRGGPTPIAAAHSWRGGTTRGSSATSSRS
jgi:hypothetical protein